MFDPEFFSDTPDNLRSLRAAHRGQEENLRYLNQLLEEIKQRFVRLDSGLADFQASVAGFGRDEAELSQNRHAACPDRPPRLPSALFRAKRPAARA